MLEDDDTRTTEPGVEVTVEVLAITNIGYSTSTCWIGATDVGVTDKGDSAGGRNKTMQERVCWDDKDNNMTKQMINSLK